MERDINVKARGIHWPEVLAIILSLCGAYISDSGAIHVYISQVSRFDMPMWPLPGLFLVYWAMLGVINLIFTFLIARNALNNYLYTSWLINGAFIPLIILGALSIGSAVLLGFVFFLLSSILQSVHKKVKLITSLGRFALGIIVSAGVSAIMITLGNLPFFLH
jgi:hypothetical protein